MGPHSPGQPAASSTAESEACRPSSRWPSGRHTRRLRRMSLHRPPVAVALTVMRPSGMLVAVAVAVTGDWGRSASPRCHSASGQQHEPGRAAGHPAGDCPRGRLGLVGDGAQAGQCGRGCPPVGVGIEVLGAGMVATAARRRCWCCGRAPGCPAAAGWGLPCDGEGAQSASVSGCAPGPDRVPLGAFLTATCSGAGSCLEPSTRSLNPCPARKRGTEVLLTCTRWPV